ncbi:MAG: FAD-dependent oxidoreductase, partial [Chlorobiota bacterium]
EQFRKKLHEEGVEVITGCPLTRAEKHPGGINLVFADRPAEVFPKVVVTAAAPLAARLCTDLNADELSRLEGVLYQGILCASVLLDRPLGGFYVLNLLDGGLPFTGVIEMSTLVQPGHLGGYHLAYLPKYVPAEDPAFSLSDEEIDQPDCQQYPEIFT